MVECMGDFIQIGSRDVAPADVLILSVSKNRTYLEKLGGDKVSGWKTNRSPRGPVNHL